MSLMSFARTLLSPRERSLRPLKLWLEAPQIARRRGARLLIDNLSADQAADYIAQGHFHVVGGATGRKYRVRRGTQMNVDIVDDYGVIASTLCFVPTGNLVEGDILLAQKLALELFEDEVLSVANRAVGGRIRLLM